MRTNIVLDDELMKEAMRYSSARSKRAVVHEALATYIAVKATEQKSALYRDRLAGIRRRLMDKALKTSSREIVRADRERDA